MSEGQLLFRTVHGSRLYGTNHENSDWDYWEVYSNKVPSPAKWIKQKIEGKDDRVRLNLSTFTLYAYRSSHQVLEAMFSDRAEVDELTAFRNSFRLNTYTFVPLYKRTIKSFVFNEDRKSKMHAARLCFNLMDGLEYGRFNPTMSGRRLRFLQEADVRDLEGLVEHTLAE